MKITITAEKYYNSPPPILTKKILDWLFLTMWSTRMEHYINKLETLEIRTNQAYKGSGRIHFYIKVNDEHDFHKVFEENFKLYYQNPPVGSQYEKREFNLCWGGKKKRRSWLYNLESKGVDCGEEGKREVERFEKSMRLKKERDATKKEKDRKEQEYQEYLKLKEKYEKTNN